ASGHKALHDEDKIFAQQLAAASAQARRQAGLVPDWYGFTLSFKGVLLEGLEVVFIVLTFGANQHDIGLAAVAGAAAVVVVAGAGVAIRSPLSRVPENSLKFIVGIMLTAFGTFWGAEGAGAHWPGSDAALLALIPAIAAFALALVAGMRRSPGGSGRQRTPRPAAATAGRGGRGRGADVVRRIKAFLAFWYDFIIGDDWLVAAGVVIALALTYALSRTTVPAWWLLPLALAVLLPVSLWREARKQRG